ncbi:hypothetical protein [Kitasatospora sp. NPDC097691]|uniref:hypothetical protein n=1 Tax=Kitasatospora sp. NPDC097691 TaxID=3157231 RepID=UPI0033164E5A
MFERDTDAEATAFEPVADAVGALAAHLEVVRPGLLAGAAAGAARFHGGGDVLAERIVDAVEAVGHPCRVGVADGLFAAQLAARIVPVRAPGSWPRTRWPSSATAGWRACCCGWGS